jgi:hypothetical protein
MSEAVWWDDPVFAASGDASRTDRLRLLGRCEAIFGLTATFFLSYGSAVVLGLVSIVTLLMGEWTVFALAIGPAVLTLALAVWVTRAACGALRRCYPELEPAPRDVGPSRTDARPSPGDAEPFGVEMGLQAVRLPLFLRPVLSLWWFAHFIAGVLAAVTVHRSVAESFDRPGMLALIVLPLALNFAFNVAANLYLVLSVASLHADPWLLRKVWSARFAIDVVVMLVALALLH